MDPGQIQININSYFPNFGNGLNFSYIGIRIFSHLIYLLGRLTHLLIEKAKLLKCKYAYVTTVNDYAARIFENENFLKVKSIKYSEYLENGESPFQYIESSHSEASLYLKQISL